MIFEHETHTGKLTATLPAGNLTQVYECFPSTCMNPFCDCEEIFVELILSNELHKIGIDLKEKTLIERKDTAIIDDFAEQLFKLLHESDFKILKRIYLELKQHTSESADISEIAVEFSQDVIERQNLMIIYNEIFVYERRFAVTIENIRYVLEDHYCVKNKCSCKEVILCFYACLNEESDELMVIELNKLDFSIRVDYQLKTWVFENKSQEKIGITQVRSALENQYEDFFTKVQYRHDRLKQLYSNYLKTITPVTSQKIGRNDPCLCGSGKKYKKCCGSNSVLVA